MKIVKLGNTNPRAYLPQGPDQVGEELVKDDDWQPDPAVDYVTEIRVSPDSKLSQALAEVKTIWGIHSKNDAPDWVASSDPVLAGLLAEEFNCPIKELTA